MKTISTTCTSLQQKGDQGNWIPCGKKLILMNGAAVCPSCDMLPRKGL